MSGRLADVEELNQITEKIIQCVYAVSNKLGCGFLEKVYENALAIECEKQGLKIARQVSTKVMYDTAVVGEYVADMVVDDSVLLELKAVSRLDEVHQAQTINYLRATGLKIGLLINFGRPKVDIKRLMN